MDYADAIVLGSIAAAVAFCIAMKASSQLTGKDLFGYPLVAISSGGGFLLVLALGGFCKAADTLYGMPGWQMRVLLVIIMHLIFNGCLSVLAILQDLYRTTQALWRKQ